MHRSALAFPLSLVLHAFAATLVVLVSIITRDALPVVEAPALPPLAPYVRIPPEGDGGRPLTPPRPVRLSRPAPPREMAFVPDAPPATREDDVLEAADTAEGPPGSVIEMPCLRCPPGGGGVPGGDPNSLVAAPGPPAASGPVRTGGDIRPPLKVRHVAPVYPDIARVAHVQGTVVLDCTIGADGRVDDVKVLGGPPLLQAAAADAVRQWVYRPTLLNGVAIPVVMTVTVRFTLEASR
jgi:protein TonB